MLVWQRIWTSVLGWNPSMQYLPALPAAIIIYLSIFVVCYILYHLTRMIVPHPLKAYVLDFIKAMTFCAYPFGHGITRKFYGQIGYMALMVPLNTFTSLLMPLGIGSPTTSWLLFLKREKQLWKSFVQVFVHILGGLAAYRLGMLIFAIEFHPIYVERIRDYSKQLCSTDLNVPVYAGLLIEFLGCLYDTWLNLQVLSKNPVLDIVLKFANGGMLVGLGWNLTGMYMHPAMATGHTFGCGETTVASHVLVYWVGPLTAAYLAFMINRIFNLKMFFGDTVLRIKKKENNIAEKKRKGPIKNGEPIKLGGPGGDMGPLKVNGKSKKSAQKGSIIVKNGGVKKPNSKGNTKGKGEVPSANVNNSTVKHRGKDAKPKRHGKQ